MELKNRVEHTAELFALKLKGVIAKTESDILMEEADMLMIIKGGSDIKEMKQLAERLSFIKDRMSVLTNTIKEAKDESMALMQRVLDDAKFAEKFK